MHASETKVRQLIEGTKQYVVPLFQRPYTWSEKHWKTLWADVLEQAQHGDGRPHFFGTIVTTPAKSVPQGIAKYLLIDGQQRITTIQVLLAAIRDVASQRGESKLNERINGQYLTNAFEEGDERFKVLPTQDDRGSFRAIIASSEIPESRLRSCFQFFLARLDKCVGVELDAVHMAVVDRLSLVSITCDEHDNPHLIFESLNAKGEKLTAGDLIRNFLLMRVHVKDQERLFSAYWLPIQQALDADLTEFVRHFLMKEGRILKSADVYFELTDRLANSNPTQAESFLKELCRHGSFYATFAQRKSHADPEIAERLARVHRLKVTVAYPFLLRVFDAFDVGLLSRDQVLEALDILESFVIRRSVCGMPTNQLRRIFPPIFDAALRSGPSFIPELRKQLGGSRCPDDEKFKNALATAELYSTAEKNVRLRLMLERLEKSHGNRESASFEGTQIEHVLPQTLSAEWLEELESTDVDELPSVLHTLGNLTLTKYNPELSNRPFHEKRQLFAESHYELNRYFADVADWTAEEVRERGKALATRALGIWGDVGRTSAIAETRQQPKVTLVAIRFRDAREEVKKWKVGYIKLLNHFEAAQPGLFARLAAQESSLSALIASDPNRFPRSREKVGDAYANTHASSVHFKDWCKRIAKAANIDSGDFEFVVANPG